MVISKSGEIQTPFISTPGNKTDDVNLDKENNQFDTPWTSSPPPPVSGGKKSSSGSADFIVRQSLRKGMEVSESRQGAVSPFSLDAATLATEIKALFDHPNHQKLLGEFAAAAGMSAEDFSKAVEEQINELGTDATLILNGVSEAIDENLKNPSPIVSASELSRQDDVIIRIETENSQDTLSPVHATEQKDTTLTDVEQQVANALLQHYFVNKAGLKDNDPELDAVAARAARAFRKAGCNTFDEAREQLEKMVKHDLWV